MPLKKKYNRPRGDGATNLVEVNDWRVALSTFRISLSTFERNYQIKYLCTVPFLKILIAIKSEMLPCSHYNQEKLNAIYVTSKNSSNSRTSHDPTKLILNNTKIISFTTLVITDLTMNNDERILSCLQSTMVCLGSKVRLVFFSL